MKFLITIIAIIGTMSLFGQKTISIPKVDKNTIEVKNDAIIYGNFIQRLGFSSGGFPQDIRLQNVETNQILTLRVKPTFQSKKENIMCFKIPKGEYIIHSYWWTKSKWYGGKVHDEPIYKVSNSKPIERFRFLIKEDKIYYIGTWDFDKSIVTFKNEKDNFDKLFKSKYKKLKVKNSEIVIPE
ncbi:MAG: hypothetical protein ACI81W_004077 [Saprospiraceae bacterium]|jgi:hypothetical protein